VDGAGKGLEPVNSLNSAENEDFNSLNFDKFKELLYIVFMFTRSYEPLDQHIQPGKVMLIYGPRRVGKTTLLQNFLAGTALKSKVDSGENIRTQEILSSQDFGKILAYAEGYQLLAIDEAQNIPNIGMGLKIIVEQMPRVDGVDVHEDETGLVLIHRAGRGLAADDVTENAIGHGRIPSGRMKSW